MTTCPVIASESDDDIKLSTYTRTIGTRVVIGCTGFGRHVKDPTAVICQANGQWSEEPNLECDIKLDDKETVYVVVAVVCSLLFLFGMCWISAAILCCRNRRGRWGSRWFRDRWTNWRGFGGDRRSDDRIFMSGNKYDDDYRDGPMERKDYRESFRRSDRFREENERGWLVSRKSGRYDDNGPWRNRNPVGGDSFKRSRDAFRQNIYFMGVDGREWDRTRPPLYPGESWRYGYYGDGKSRAAGGQGDFRFRETDDVRLDSSSRRYGQGRFDRNGRYDDWDKIGKIPHNDMESVYRLRRKYDRVFDHDHPRIPNHYLPRDPRDINSGAVGPAWASNYPVLKLTDRETIYSMYGDPLFRQRRHSDTFLDRQGYRSERFDGAGEYYGYGGRDAGGYRRTRRFSDTYVDAVPLRRIEYVQESAPRKLYEAEEREINDEAVLQSPGYDIITLPSKYQTADDGPRLVQLDANNLKLPTYRRSYVQTDRDPTTDYFLSRQDFRFDTSRKSQRELDHTLYHGFGKRTEIFEDSSDLGRRPYFGSS